VRAGDVESVEDLGNQGGGLAADRGRVAQRVGIAQAGAGPVEQQAAQLR
jgi:hypothetical protein